MNDKASKLDLVLAGGIFAIMIAFILYGFLGLKIGRLDNCWDNYTTEEQAIINCEGATNE